MKTVPLNEQILSIVLMVQSYHNFIREEGMYFQSIKRPDRCKNAFYDVKDFYESLDSEVLCQNGLSKNRMSFEKVLYFPVTKDMMNASREELGKFNF